MEISINDAVFFSAESKITKQIPRSMTLWFLTFVVDSGEYVTDNES